MRWITALGILFMSLSVFPAWVEAPISGAVAGAGLQWVAILIGLAGGMACVRRSGSASAICGMIGLGLSYYYVLYVAFLDPHFWQLVDENEQYAQIIRFSFRFLPPNFGIEPTFQPNLPTESVWDRLVTAAYFMSDGWWSCLLGSLLLLVGSFATGGWQVIRGMAMTALVLVVGLGLVFSNGLTAQYLQAKGEGSLARGHFALALQYFEAAQLLDPQLTSSEQLHLRLGEAYDHLGLTSHPHALLYRGHTFIHQGQLETAIAALQLAAQEATPPLADTVHKRIAWTYVTMGLVQYRRGNISEAAALWEKVSRADASQVMAPYFLTKAYFDQGRYEQSIAIGQFILSRCRNPLVNANVQANIGDSYWRMQRYARARDAYEASMRLDPFVNLRGIKSMGGT